MLLQDFLTLPKLAEYTNENLVKKIDEIENILDYYGDALTFEEVKLLELLREAYEMCVK